MTDQAAPPPSELSVEQVTDAGVVTSDFIACYQDHYRTVLRALRLAGADPATAEDLTQDAFARAFAHWRRVRRGSNPAGYIYLSAFRSLQRSERRRTRPDRAPHPLAVGATDQDATTTVSVEHALAAMPPRRRQCAALCLLLGFPPNEAAEILRIAPSTVRKHLDDARHDLRAACAPR